MNFLIVITLLNRLIVIVEIQNILQTPDSLQLQNRADHILSEILSSTGYEEMFITHFYPDPRSSFKNTSEQKREPSYTISGNVIWCNHYGEHYGSSLKN